jgi:hypothetical protein
MVDKGAQRRIDPDFFLSVSDAVLHRPAVLDHRRTLETSRCPSARRPKPPLPPQCRGHCGLIARGLTRNLPKLAVLADLREQKQPGA